MKQVTVYVADEDYDALMVRANHLCRVIDEHDDLTKRLCRAEVLLNGRTVVAQEVRSPRTLADVLGEALWAGVESLMGSEYGQLDMHRDELEQVEKKLERANAKRRSRIRLMPDPPEVRP